MKVICFIRRKPGISPDQFRKHYEEVHVPLVLRLLPHLSGYKRQYLSDPIGPPANGVAAAPPTGFDVVTELTFASQADYEQLVRASVDPAVARQLREDEEQFVDRSFVSMFIVDERTTEAALLRHAP